ncbi:unnamed protein product [Brachionus calyciflorus]|uniref:tRNA wybutosine-synthesizing protein 3 homolog n=1 Tax=Brachionus calyciflorus TaxID=104777 RepID=A0A814FME1_9BILA|nr:unnamed protein product [Brachionus calyciflorus]
MTTLKINLDNYAKNFDVLKSQQLIIEDASRKSSIDFRIQPLCNAINNSENYFTTSSCSGRFIAFSQDEQFIKKNCEWIRVTHDPLNENEIQEFINAIESHKSSDISLKFEPFILHVCCRSLNDAKSMLEQCIASGYRNSGISLGSSKIILAVRSTQNLECPITSNGNLMVDLNYIRYICNLANEKFQENFERIERFYKNIEPCLNPEKIEKTKSKKELKAEQRLNKKIMFENLKSTGQLKKQERRDSEDSDKHESCLDEIDNLFSS